MDPAERELFARTLRKAVKDRSGAVLDAAADEVGWPDALSVDERAAVSILFELQGELGAASSTLDTVLATCLGLETRPAAGVVLPSLGCWEPPGMIDGKQLLVRGLGMTGLAEAANALVVTRADDREVVVAVPIGDINLRSVEGVDPKLGLVEVTADVPSATVTRRRLAREWSSAVALGQLALAHELLGASRKMLDLAREHALERVQFGRTIGTFQAVRHRLAEALIAVEAADGMLDAAWEDRSPRTASIAKALAGRGARTVSRHCQQVLAGMGFTTEHPFHRYLRRVLVLDQLLGSARLLTRELGAELLRARTLPALFPL